MLGAYGAGSTLTLMDVDLQGGSIGGSGGGLVGTNGFYDPSKPGVNTLDGSTAGAITITAGATLLVGVSSQEDVLGTLVNEGAVEVQGAFQTGGGDVALTGGGKVILEHGLTTGWSTTSAATLHNGNNVVSGWGIIGFTYYVDNLLFSTIRASGSST